MNTSNTTQYHGGTNTVPSPQPLQGACPHCGYCPHCGRSAMPVPMFQPWPNYPNPYVGDNPNHGWIVTC